MRFVKSILRWVFGLQALVSILVPVGAIAGALVVHLRSNPSLATSTHSPTVLRTIVGCGVLAGTLAIGLLFAMAWWTTRKPSAGRSIWAIAASVISLAEGTLLFWLSPLASFTFIKFTHGDALWLVAFGAVGILVFLRGEGRTAPSIAVPKRTPIAGDRTTVWTRHAVAALSYMAQIAAIVVWGIWAHDHHLFRARGLTWIALIVIGSILTTLVHEFGHAIVAWCFEMGLLSFKAGPFQWEKRKGKWKFKFHAAGLLTAGGAVGAVPTSPDPPRWEEIFMIAAGPLANLAVGVPAIWAVLHDNWTQYQQTWEFVAFTGSFCLIAAVLNLFPFMSEDGAYSDGARILQIVTHSPVDDYHRTWASIASTLITARRYRELDIAAIERAAGLFPQELRGLNLRLCACHFYEDSSRFPEASAALAVAEFIYNNNSIDLPGPLHTVFVIGHAYLNRDAAAARLWWDRMEAKKGDRSNVDYWLARTALKWIEGNLSEAEEAWQEADIESQSLPRFGSYELDRFRCAMLRQALDSPMQPSVASPASTAPDARALAPAAVAEILRPSRTAIYPVPATPADTEPKERFIFTKAAAISAAEAALHATPAMFDPLPASAKLIAPVAASLLDPLARITKASTASTPSSNPADVLLRERLLRIDATAMPSAENALHTSTGEVFAPLPSAASLPIPPAAVASIPEMASLPTGVVVPRRTASFTRIPASSSVVSQTPAARIGLSAAVPSSEFPALSSLGAGPSSKAPAVPAAFARRPVRPVPSPPSSPYAESAFDIAPASDIPASSTSAQFASTSAAAAPPYEPAPISLASAAKGTVFRIPSTPPPPSEVPPSTPRFDPLEFIRAEALENLRR